MLSPHGMGHEVNTVPLISTPRNPAFCSLQLLLPMLMIPSVHTQALGAEPAAGRRGGRAQSLAKHKGTAEPCKKRCAWADRAAVCLENNILFQVAWQLGQEERAEPSLPWEVQHRCLTNCIRPLPRGWKAPEIHPLLKALLLFKEG